MNSDDAILRMIEAGIHLLLVAEPHSQEGFSIVPNKRIKGIADAIRDLRTEFCYSDLNNGKSDGK